RTIEEPDGRLVLLADVRPEQVRLAAALERVGEEWRIIAPPEVPRLPYEGEPLLVKSVIVSGPPASDFQRMAPRPRQEGAARAVGERYLRAWAQGQEGLLRELTSPLAIEYAPDAATFHRRLAYRLDRGVAPVS